MSLETSGAAADVSAASVSTCLNGTFNFLPKKFQYVSLSVWTSAK